MWYSKFKNPKNIIQHQTLVFSIVCSKCKNEEDEKIFKEEESIEILKIIGSFKKYIITLKIWLKKT